MCCSGWSWSRGRRWRPRATRPSSSACSYGRTGRIAATPRGAGGRRWLHRYPPPLGQLCLWYPDDPPALGWQWSDGLAAFITIAHRHLQAEEYWRRTGIWPAEDVPHGEGPHPIRSPALRAAAFWRHR